MAFPLKKSCQSKAPYPVGYHQRKAKEIEGLFFSLSRPLCCLFADYVVAFGQHVLLSLTDWQGLVKPKIFVGLTNFIRLVGYRHFQRALKNTGIHILISMPGVLLPAFILGFFLSQRRPGYRLLRLIFFSPAMISVTAIAMIFVGVYLPDGTLNTLLRAIGLELGPSLVGQQFDSAYSDHRDRFVRGNWLLCRSVFRCAVQCFQRPLRSSHAGWRGSMDSHVADWLSPHSGFFRGGRNAALDLDTDGGIAKRAIAHPGRAWRLSLTLGYICTRKPLSLIS